MVALLGLFETSVVCGLDVNPDIRLSADEEDSRVGLQRMLASGPSYYISAGGAELSGLIDHQ